MIWWFHCPNLIISTTLQSDLFSPTETPRFCVVIGTRKVVRARQKGNQWRRRSPIRRCPTMLQARWKNCKKNSKNLGAFDIWDGFSKDWVWMVCNVCSLDGMWWVFSHSLFSSGLSPRWWDPCLSHSQAHEFNRSVQRCISGWNGWATVIMGWGISRSAERKPFFWMPHP